MVILILGRLCTLSAAPPARARVRAAGRLAAVRIGDRYPSVSDMSQTTTDLPLPLKTLVEVAELLLERGAKVNATDRRGNTPLRLARLADYDDLIDLLRANGGR